MTDDIPDQTPHADKTPGNGEQKTVTAIYGTLCAAIILQLAPHVGLSVFATLLLLGTWIMIGVMRRGADRDSLMVNHMTFLNITLWVWSILLLTAAAIGGYYVHARYDLSAFMQLAQEYAAGNTGSDMMREIKTLTIAAGAPCYLYAAYRLAKGLKRAMGGYRIANPNNPL